MARRGVAPVCHARHGPGLLRRLAHRVLHPVKDGVQVVAVVQEGREFGVLRAPAQRHHHGLCHFGCECRPQAGGDAVQREVDAGGHAGAAEHRSVQHEHPVGQHLAVGRGLAQFVQMVVVRRGFAARQQAGAGGHHGASADAHQLHLAFGQAQAMQPVQQLARGGAVQRDLVTRLAYQHHPLRALGPGQVGQRDQPRHPGAHRTDRFGARAGEMQRKSRRLAFGLQRLVGHAQRLGRTRPIEDQAVVQQHEMHVHHSGGRQSGRFIHR